MDPKVYDAFQAFPDETRDRLLTLRELIYDIARQTDGVGPVSETLKWGQISYLNPSGTTLRIGTVDSNETLALYVHCQTSIVDDLKAAGSTLTFDGKRCIHLPVEDLDTAEVRAAIIAALTYKS